MKIIVDFQPYIHRCVFVCAIFRVLVLLFFLYFFTAYYSQIMYTTYILDSNIRFLRYNGDFIFIPTFRCSCNWDMNLNKFLLMFLLELLINKSMYNWHFNILINKMFLHVNMHLYPNTVGWTKIINFSGQHIPVLCNLDQGYETKRSLFVQLSGVTLFRLFSFLCYSL